MKIGLDFDGVIANCGKLKSDAAKKLYGIDIPSAKFTKKIIVGEHLIIEQYSEFQNVIYGTREIGFLMEPVDGVLYFLPKLIAERHTIIVITSREKEGLNIAQEWSLRHGLQLNFIGVGQSNSKSEMAVANSIDLYVDDDLDKIKPLVGIVPHRYLFTWDYNAHVDVGTIATRIASWQQLYSTIQQIEATNNFFKKI